MSTAAGASLAAPATEASVSPIKTLFPGYFALVMATGIISIAASQQSIDWLAQALYAVAATGYTVLTVMLTLRIVLYPRAFIADVQTHTKGFAFLTTVAGTNVLASASAIVHGWWALAWVLWWVSLGLWAFFLYATLISTVVRGNKPALGGGINGTWFLLTVSTQSIVVVGGLVFDRHPSDTLAFALLAAFLVGIVLYLIVMTMVFLRWTFHELEPTEVDPPAWIAAGAVAITVLAGSNLLIAAPDSERLTRLAGFVEGMTVLAWATATFWFPLMIAIGVWRHGVRRVPLRYHPSYWSLVFPIGMYSAATYRMRAAIDLESLEVLPKLALAGAIVAWSATAIGLGHQGITSLLTRRSNDP
ncbi:MAG: tellurite resistance/C4-dicarboxylate transporter family protein [Ilumatobacter sp.]|uniref:tellurite resistance/C4-dicarboxylate transporter family protein n=1 Tax=Ilumatobacter sp. TaxID=1967498 RepID=UPI00391D9138